MRLVQDHIHDATRRTKGPGLRIAAIVALVLLGLAAPRVRADAEAAPATRHLVVRYDDYAPVTDYQNRPGDVELETRLFRLFDDHNTRIVAGVIPFPVAGDRDPLHDPSNVTAGESWLTHADSPWVALLREYVDKGVVEPALHGFEHRRRTPRGTRPGEFRGQPPAWQRDALVAGRDVLAAAIGRPPRVFVPPWNAWDADTARGLDAAGFLWLSPDWHLTELPGDAKLGVVPQCTACPIEALTWIQSPDAVDPGSVIVLVTHPFDFTGPGGDAYFTALSDLLDKVSASSEWDCIGFTQLPTQPTDDWPRRFRQAVAWQRAQELLGDGIGGAALRRAEPPIFKPTAWYDRNLQKARLAVALLMILSAAVGGLGAFTTARYLLRSRRLAVAGCLLCTAALAALLWGAFSIERHGYHVRSIRWQAICVAAGATLVCSIRLVRAGRRRGREAAPEFAPEAAPAQPIVAASQRNAMFVAQKSGSG